ncbi:MarR family winged helix-turn-helix transcriptional regulator [Paraburkholderia acidipaludis]|uniref:MarR family winged helix-turn-helix transcriptional regulator n=1 Tax=Paraburkholderia acidipaludis TaxID=660537 RepID=UPI00047F2553|nr:MarR family winged helix-turn-helix transcriptional regulator [Paraburkholderia acidipaludis]
MSHDDEDSFLPVQNVGFALSKAGNLLTGELEAALASAGASVSASHVGALLLLARDMAHTPVALSRLLGVDSGSVTRTVDRLERGGYVRRDRSSADRRVVNLTLTDAGQHVARQVGAIVPAVLNRRLENFTSLEFATFSNLLRKLLDE